MGKSKSYDSYIRAVRWASDRIGGGIIGFVSNAGFLDSNSSDGLRKCLSRRVFFYRDIPSSRQSKNARWSFTKGGKIFDSGSRAAIAIYFLVKNPAAAEQGKIMFYDIGDYHSREDKLRIIEDFKSIAGISSLSLWSGKSPLTHIMTG